MARRARKISSTNYYHVIMRGNNKGYIFETKEAKGFFMAALKKIEEEGLVDLAAWCIMDNHVHLVLRAEPEDLGLALKRLNIRFAMYHHKKEETVGHVFQDRFKSETIESEASLMNVVRYVHNNPVKAKIVNEPGDYKWSSYNKYLHKAHNETMAFVWELFNGNQKKFNDFHNLFDDQEYLEIKEDQEIQRLAAIETMIQSVCIKHNINEAIEIKNHKEATSEIVMMMVEKMGLSGRQIAQLIGVSESHVRKMKQSIEV